jgi:putative RecB family exonuclease
METLTLPVEHLSSSQVNMYLRCPAQYYFRYCRGLKLPPTAPLTRGKCVHSGAEYNYKHKLQTRQDRPVQEVLEYVDAEFEEAREATDWQDKDPGQVKDETIALAETYHTQVATKIQPYFVEKGFTFEVPGLGIPYQVYLDLVDEDLVIRDTKTSGRTPAKTAIAQSLQLTSYHLCFQMLTGFPPAGVALDYVVANKTPKIVTLTGKKTEADVERFLGTVERVADAITKDVYFPNENNFMCSPDRCGYWDVCHGEFRRRAYY